MSDRHTISPEYQVRQARKVKRLEADNSNLRARWRWIDARTTTPAHNVLVLATDGQDMEVLFWHDSLDIKGGFGRTVIENGHAYAEHVPNITHWMPLPHAPEKEAGAET